ncbi:hypothetical protein B0H17DRAFT_1211492 [Mycena rosella]|uniref:Uncharacterized protein n=1 Tax=Mycena rosella TaxID=1033263 RepID=A0AAD7CU13_MYCRO|nr:hypothetical protein B0H17DRAFT_1211492 [Mycena rosella]
MDVRHPLYTYHTVSSILGTCRSRRPPPTVSGVADAKRLENHVNVHAASAASTYAPPCPPAAEHILLPIRLATSPLIPPPALSRGQPDLEHPPHAHAIAHLPLVVLHASATCG